MATGSTTLTPALTPTVYGNALHPLPSDPPLYGDRRRVAFVSGAAQGIGLAIALRLARDGFDVAVNDINGAELESAVKAVESVGARSVGVVGDVGDEESVEKMIEHVVATLGYLDVMVANAGIAVAKPFLEMTVSDMDKLFHVNLHGVFLCYKYAAKHFIEQKTGGKLIATSSVAGFQPFAYLGGYVSSKWAVRGLNESAALELAPHGITANLVAPGTVKTQLSEQAGEELRRHMDLTASKVQRQALATDITLGRLAIPDDIANVVSFLASRNSDYITGQTLLVDGGIHMT
ncbi:hypothetical protein BS47DRAFT_1325967 [Hydnum rufescens UP504]|uniref:Uncharacterized protein n=1 Tax=Hydnum rufescens UP504 TaxID=1448309 RepID=A0A9P6B5F9_9AGAM|nr:hypothetical protein BS47DRAFT_1325967 [Hydnum rufescens UP504]